MKLIRSIAATFLAILVLVSSTSFVVGVHFCMGEIQDVALFAKAEPCKMEQTMPPCHRHQQAPCCEDETIIHQGTDFKSSFQQISVVAPTPIEMEHPLILISEVIPSVSKTGNHFQDYHPPLRTCDLTVAHRVFLI